MLRATAPADRGRSLVAPSPEGLPLRAGGSGPRRRHALGRTEQGPPHVLGGSGGPARPAVAPGGREGRRRSARVRPAHAHVAGPNAAWTGRSVCRPRRPQRRESHPLDLQPRRFGRRSSVDAPRDRRGAVADVCAIDGGRLAASVRRRTHLAPSAGLQRGVVPQPAPARRGNVGPRVRRGARCIPRSGMGNGA